jgi:hypothetical protein
MILGRVQNNPCQEKETEPKQTLLYNWRIWYIKLVIFMRINETIGKRVFYFLETTICYVFPACPMRSVCTRLSYNIFWEQITWHTDIIFNVSVSTTLMFQAHIFLRELMKWSQVSEKLEGPNKTYCRRSEMSNYNSATARLPLPECQSSSNKPNYGTI